MSPEPGSFVQRSPQRLDQDVTRDTTAESNLHAMDLHQHRPVERTATGEMNGISGVDSQVVQPPAQAMASVDIHHSRFVSRGQLIESHN